MEFVQKFLKYWKFFYSWLAIGVAFLLAAGASWLLGRSFPDDSPLYFYGWLAFGFFLPLWLLLSAILTPLLVFKRRKHDTRKEKFNLLFVNLLTGLALLAALYLAFTIFANSQY
ncbi:MAG: hypothetical protein A2785_01270 [Candidatus Chisholmbacteria bacterium RIFCSPHIGHO2_01_FULL_49_18]|uniref:Uncharacterized protein n=1 Tax=Candidatus Chisholmbacteria bacterium RIFCSPHIGHO2_01_FULL_49_18 TaxID=1797590 RepID=A0A1G1VLI6_9BACT|nr:MAG: hypothetical protein A2785_01270 [Candidatus Chisholmbacteria bacterium RIFCSPHIGHO2_01_FULL_49_18]